VNIPSENKTFPVADVTGGVPVVGAPAAEAPAEEVLVAQHNERWQSPLRYRIALASLLVGAWVALMVLATNTNQWFFADEWEFIARRSRPAGLGDTVRMYLRPHNEHWSTLPLLVYRAIFGVVGLKAYWPYLIVHLAAHVGLGLLLARRFRSDRVRVPVVLLTTATFLFLGAGSENILWAFQTAWIAALGFCLIGLEIVDRAACQQSLGSGQELQSPESGLPVGKGVVVGLEAERGWGPPARGSLSRSSVGWLWVVGVAALMCAGTGVSSVVAICLSVLLRFGWRKALLVGSVPGAIMAVWLLSFGRDNSSEPVSWGYSPYRVGSYAWRALVGMIDRTTGFAGLGVLVAVALLFGALHRYSDLVRMHASSLSLAIAGVFFSVVVALGRVRFDDPEASRYSYVLFVFFVPLLMVLLEHVLVGRPRVWQGVATAVSGFFLLNSIGVLTDNARIEGIRELQLKRTVVAAFSVANSALVAPQATPDARAPDLTMGRIRNLITQGILVPGKPEKDLVALVSAISSVDVTPMPRVPLDAEAIVFGATGRLNVAPAESGCLLLTPTGAGPQFSLLLRRPATFKIVVSTPGAVVVTVKRDGVGSPPIGFPAAASNPMFVNLTDPKNEYVIGINESGFAKVCGIGEN
jgi:hypothetical protein